MPAYNFKQQFADDVVSGRKCQTIRARGKRRPPKVGETLSLYCRMRTTFCRKLKEVVCTSVTPISISIRSHCVQVAANNVFVNLDNEEITQLARDDGFSSADDFFSFFEREHGATFNGYLIKWSAQL